MVTGRALLIAAFSILCLIVFVASTHPVAERTVGGGARLHLLAFGSLAITAALCWRDQRPRLSAYAFLFGFGAVIEIIHSQMPARTGSLADLGVNLAGIALGAWIAASVGGLARWWQRRRTSS